MTFKTIYINQYDVRNSNNGLALLHFSHFERFSDSEILIRAA